ncbi:hypothetical protein AB0D67_06110 [Streptosporangium sp. NPDC048047]|uniref:hypothetical protein n=1 Tax=Streptosporangium sp. NPDC048047 TaxID=3155748 RepID=UPI00341B4589
MSGHGPARPVLIVSSPGLRAVAEDLREAGERLTGRWDALRASVNTAGMCGGDDMISQLIRASFTSVMDRAEESVRSVTELCGVYGAHVSRMDEPVRQGEHAVVRHIASIETAG